MKQYSIGQFAKEIGITVQTLRNWDKSGKLKPSYTSPSGHRYYSEDQLAYPANRSNARRDENVEVLLQILTVFKTNLDNYYMEIIGNFIDELSRAKEERGDVND